VKFLFHFYDLHQRAGIQRAICELSNALLAEGHEVVLVSATQPGQTAYPLDSRAVMEYVRLPEPQFSGIPAWPAKTFWAGRQILALRRIVRRHRPSLIVDHGTALGLLYPRRTLAGIPFVLQRHFPVRAFPRGGLLYPILASFTANKAVVALTHSIETELRRQGYLRVWTIPNVLPSDAVPAPYSEADPRTGLLMGRAGNPQKGFDIFLRALALHPIQGWRFRIVGPGVHNDPTLRRIIEENHLQGFVELHSPTDDPYRAIRKSACLIMPSRYEALPMVALEALSIGRPIIGSDVDGIRDIVHPEVNGLLFPAEDVAKLSAILIDISNHPEKLEQLARRTSETVGLFRRESVTRMWVSLIQQLNLDV